MKGLFKEDVTDYIGKNVGILKEKENMTYL
jgi:hypothetical protein